MVGLGFLLTFGGYTLFAYGFSQIRGQNAGFIEVLWPQSKGFAPAAPDGGTPLTAPSAAGQAGGNKTASGGSFGPGSPNSPSTGGALR